MMIADLGDLRAPTAGAKTGPAARRSEAATNPDVTCRSLGMREHWPGGRQAAGGGCILWTAPAAVRGWWASRGWMGGLAGGADVRRGRAGGAGGCPIGAVPRISPG